jgi:TRAP-type C4-dicarboxylate transport system substrate-binding protein
MRLQYICKKGIYTTDTDIYVYTGAHTMASNIIQVCMVTTMAGVLKGKPESIRRKLYRVLESVSWWTPLGWVMDLRTYNEYKQKLQEIAEEFAKETNGRQLFYLTTIMMNYKELERLLQYSKEPANQEIAKRLKRILEVHKELVELAT